MNIASGHTCIMRNMATGQEAQCSIHEINEYKGHYIVQATVHQTGVRVVRGVVETPPRLACFVLLRSETEDRVKELSKALGGLPLALCERHSPIAGFVPMVAGPVEVVYIVNSDRKRFWPGPASEVKHRAARIIDLYLEWKGGSYMLPQWFRDYAAITRTGQPRTNA